MADVAAALGSSGPGKFTSRYPLAADSVTDVRRVFQD